MGRQRGNRNRREEVQVGIYKTRIAFSSSLNWESSSKEVTEGRLIFSNIKLKKKLVTHWNLNPSLVTGGVAQGGGGLSRLSQCCRRPPAPSPPHPLTGRKGGKGNAAQHLFLDPAH